MYEREATMLVSALESRVRGRASAKKGPGLSATVRYHVEGRAIVFNVIFVGGKITVEAVTEPEGRALWGGREHPISATGIATAVSEIIEWSDRNADDAAVRE